MEAKPKGYIHGDALEIKRAAYMPTSWFWGDLSDTLIDEPLEAHSEPESSAESADMRGQLVQEI